jgi:hypothetical protein
MAWIYLAESEESQKPWRDTSSRSPTVNPIRIAKGSFYPAWILDTFLALQCGTTYELCAAPTCPYHRKSSTAVSLAKTFQWQDAERAWAESAADYFSRSFGSLARYDRDSSSWRTSQLLLFEERSELLANFAGSGMTVDGEFYPLRTWARITGEKDGGYWPTPDTISGGPSKTGDKVRPNGTKAQIRLNTAVLHRHLWPTPQARSAPDCPSERNRHTPSLDSQVGGNLNPTWVEWLMGYPGEWTVLEALGNAVVPAQAREAFERLMGL